MSVLILSLLSLWIFTLTDTGRLVRDKIFLKVPIFGNLIKQNTLSKFSKTFGILISAGVSVLDSMGLIVKVVDNRVFELAVIDVSFISLMKILPVIHKLISFPNEIVALVKPQFEVGKNRVGKGGIVRDHKLHKEVLLNILKESTDLGISPCNVTDSPILGTKGNREFFIHFFITNNNLIH